MTQMIELWIKNYRRGKIHTRLYQYLMKWDETVFWRAAPCSLVESYQRFVENYCPTFKTKKISDLAGQSDKVTFYVAQIYF
jgi:hypothetical protein